MEVGIQNFAQDCYEDEDFARVTASTREISRFGGGPMVSLVVSVTSARFAHHFGARLLQLFGCILIFLDHGAHGSGQLSMCQTTTSSPTGVPALVRMRNSV